MIYLLIDTCTLLQLINEAGYNKSLLELTNLVNNHKVEFLTHKIVIDQWNRHIEKRKKDKERKLLYFKDQSKNNSDNLLPSLSSLSIDHIESQVLEIYKLLKKAVLLETQEIIQNEFSDRFKKKLAPFHNNRNSQEDWEIIGTACQYCHIHGIRDLYFLSHNHKEFADPKDINKTIHPDIQNRFKQVKIHYFRNYSDFFKDFNTFLPVDLIPYQIIRNEKFNHKASMKSNVLDSIYYIYNELYTEINFIPIHILKKFFPFSKTEDSNAHYSIFVLYNVNETLISFFENVVIKNNNEIEFKNESLLTNINDYKDKTEFALTHLTSNLIFDLSGEKHLKRVDIHYSNPKKNCDCYVCSFNRFEFFKTFRDLKIQPEEIKEKLKAAYLHCQLGNFQSAIIFYEEILIESLNRQNYISYFIAKYNLRHIGNFLRNFLYNKTVDYKKSTELLEIDPLEEAIKLKGHTDSNLLSFVATEDFFSSAFQNINEERNKILEHYYSQLDGGSSSNPYVWNLICEFANLDSFLSNNYIIYDMYSNFEKLFEIVTDGLLASHAITDKQDSRFAHFDNYWISKFIIYGNWKTIVKYFNRYKLKVLKYKSSSTEQDTFMDLYKNLLQNEENIRHSIIDFADNNSNFFQYKYNKMFENAIVIASLLELDDKTKNECSSILLSFLNTQKLLNSSSFECIKLFLNRNRKRIIDNTLFGFIDFFINNECAYQIDILEILIGSLTQKNGEKLSEENFNSLLSGSFKKDRNANVLSDYLIIKLYEKVTGKRKEIILNTITIDLNKSHTFNKYYIYAINGIIPFDENKIMGWVNDFNIEAKSPSLSSFFGQTEGYQNNYLNELLNLCFKYNLDTASKEFEKLKKVHPYYEWIIDMDNFDYSKFDPDWVLNYQTIFYIRKMSKSVQLKNALVSFLKNNNHTRVERLLIRITYFANN